MTDLHRVSARRTVLGHVKLRVEPLLEEVLDALGRAAVDDPDGLLALLVELGQAQADLDDDRVRRLPNLQAIRDDIATHARIGQATVLLTPATARRLHDQLGDALADRTERTAA